MTNTKKPLALHWKIIIGLVLGVIFALLSAQFGWGEFTENWVAPFGKIFINMLKLVAVPMVLFSIIAGVVSLGDPSSLGRMGLKTLGMYLLTTIFACTVGLTAVNLWGPGERLNEDQRLEYRMQYELWVESTDGVEIIDGQDFLHDPQHAELAQQARDEFGSVETDPTLKSKMDIAKAEKGAGPLKFVVDLVPENIFLSLSSNKLMLQVIFFAVFFGITLLTISKQRAEPVIDLVHGLGDVFIKMVTLIMNGAPFFVFALLAGTMNELAGDDPKQMLDIFAGLAHYSLTVAVGLILMLLVFYPLLARIITKMPLKKFMKGILPAQMMAFSTSSSVATLPVTLSCVQKNLGVDKKTTSFVLPIGATVNMDGTCLYQAVAVVFMAQMHGVDLTLMQQFTIVLTATLASIGAAAVPSAGLVLMIAVLESVGLNPAWIAIIFPVDRILDMIRTMVNVTGDATVSTVIAHSEGQLHKAPVLEVAEVDNAPPPSDS